MLLRGFNVRELHLQIQTQEPPEFYEPEPQEEFEMIFRSVPINRKRTPQQAIDATRKKQCVDASVLLSVPKGEGDYITVIFFRVGRFMSGAKALDRIYKSQDLAPADPYALFAVNEADDQFAVKYPNLTHWKEDYGNWNMAAFSEWEDGMKSNGVYVGRDPGDYLSVWWYAARPRPTRRIQK